MSAYKSEIQAAPAMKISRPTGSRKMSVRICPVVRNLDEKVVGDANGSDEIKLKGG
jgi:hypothetical protein